MCPGCSKKLNHHSKKREVKRLKKRSKIKSKAESSNSVEDSGEKPCDEITLESAEEDIQTKSEESPWENLKPVEIKTRDEEMEDYLEGLLL